MPESTLGIIGGSGLYQIDGFENQSNRELDTPFGKPSAAYVSGDLGGKPVVFLPRHGPGHRLMPSEINYRANIHGFRQLGVRHLLSISAVGSLREDIRPGDMVVPLQFIDRTRNRVNTFFGQGAVAHVQFGDPVCPVMVKKVAAVLRENGVRHHTDCTYVAMEGPAFSTRAESELYRSWGADVIGMTAIPEAKLAREAEMCYATLALSTDYDCWHHTEEEVSVASVLDVIKKNVSVAQDTIRSLAAAFPLEDGCACQSALDDGLITPAKHIPPESRERLGLLIERFLKN